MPTQTYLSPDMPHVGDIGAKIRITVVDRRSGSPLPLPNANINFVALPPTQTVPKVWIAQPETNGSDGVFFYITQTPNDLSEPDVWQIQPEATDGLGQFDSDIVAMRVLPNLRVRP